MKINNCLGCFDYLKYNNPICVESNKDRSCPCTECVVKMMCRDLCEDREKWGILNKIYVR